MDSCDIDYISEVVLEQLRELTDKPIEMFQWSLKVDYIEKEE